MPWSRWSSDFKFIKAIPALIKRIRCGQMDEWKIESMIGRPYHALVTEMLVISGASKVV
jgi:hypothetical protein